MPLIKTPNQPLFSDPNRPTEEGCGRDYCHLVRTDDNIYAQFTQTPCVDNEACDADFTDISTVNISTDDFTSTCPGNFSALTGAWACGGGGLSAGSSVANGTATFNPAGLTQWNTYKVQISVNPFSQGWVEFFFGSTSSNSSSGRITTGGDYTFYIVNESAIDSAILLASGDTEDLGYFNGTVTSVQIDDISATCWTTGSGTWQIDGTGGACKTDTSLSGALVENTPSYIVANDYYYVSIVISDYVSGSVTVSAGLAGTDDSDAFSKNGTHEFWIEPQNAGVLTITPTADFIGCIDSVNIQSLRNDHTITLIDADTLAEIDDVSSYITYYNQYVTLCFTPQEINQLSGCYRLYAFDQCDIQYQDQSPNPTFSPYLGPPVQTPPDGWLNNNAAQMDYSGDSAVFSYNSAAIPTQTSNVLIFSDKMPDLIAGDYEIKFDIIANSDTTNIGITIFLDNALPSSFSYYSTVMADHTISVTGYDPDDYGDIKRMYVYANFNVTGGGAVNGSVEIGNVRINRVAPFSATYQSECFKIGSSFSNTKLITGYSDEPDLGFDFNNTGFKLQQRLELRSLSPQWNIDRDGYTFSTGTRKNQYSEIEKYWELFIEAAPESVHGALAMQANTDHFSIGDNPTDALEYEVRDGDYVPEWERSGAADIAPGRMEVRIKEAGSKFHRRC